MRKFRLAILLGMILTLGFKCLKTESQTIPSLETHSYSIQLSTQSTALKPASPIYAKITLKNASDYPVPIQTGYLPASLTGMNGLGLDGSYGWSCTDGIRQDATKPGMGSDHTYIVFQAGRTRAMNVRLDLACDFSRPGLYRVAVTRKPWMHSSDPALTSNSITIEIK